MIQLETQHISINRLIVHKILEQKITEENSSVEFENTVINVNNKGKEILIERIINALGKQSKSFELNVELDKENSFFYFANCINKLNEEDFIFNSKEIANLLGFSQNRIGLPGGYLLIIDAFDNLNKTPLIIVIKAEQQSVLQHEIGTNSLNVLENVFLSPAQKLFKIGILGFENYRADSIIRKEDCFALLFDDQFRDGKPAEYFYKSFLGFSIDKNSKINTYKFYQETVKFINSQVKEEGDRVDFLRFLKAYLSPVSSNLLIDSIQFIKSTTLSEADKAAYITKTSELFPRAFTKDISLIKNNLSRRKINFSNDINVVGPEENFEEKVRIITDINEFKNIDFEKRDFTVILIEGKPYKSNGGR